MIIDLDYEQFKYVQSNEHRQKFFLERENSYIVVIIYGSVVLRTEIDKSKTLYVREALNNAIPAKDFIFEDRENSLGTSEDTEMYMY